jgi:hypothetical protein
MIREIGICGRMNIISSGVGYEINDDLIFSNPTGSYGIGASGYVRNVDTNGSITEVEFNEINGFLIGGSGYNPSIPPTISVSSANINAYGASIIVDDLLGYGAEFRAANTVLGAIERITIVDAGQNYEDIILDLTKSGDGTAEATATLIEGVYSYPGRFLNDDGFLSSHNFLQGRDYYQNFSYVIRSTQSLNNYRKAIKDLVHPAGLKLFGEYTKIDDLTSNSISINVSSSGVTYHNSSYNTTSDLVVNKLNHGYNVGDDVLIEFISGGFQNNEITTYDIETVLDANTVTIQMISVKDISDIAYKTNGNGIYNI